MDAEFKTLVIKMLWQLNECGKNIKEEMKATLSEIRKSPKENNCEGKEAEI